MWGFGRATLSSLESDAARAQQNDETESDRESDGVRRYLEGGNGACIKRQHNPQLDVDNPRAQRDAPVLGSGGTEAGEEVGEREVFRFCRPVVAPVWGLGG